MRASRARSADEPEMATVLPRSSGASERGEAPARSPARGPLLLAAMVLLLLAAPVIAAWFVVRSLDAALVRQAADGQLAVARTLAGQIAKDLDTASRLARQRAHAPGFVRFVEQKDAPNARAVFENLAETLAVYRALAAFDRDGSLLVGYPDVPAIDIARLGNAPSDVTRPTLVGDEPILPLVENVAAPGGSPVGFLVAEISLERALPAISSLRFGRTGTATLVLRDGRVLLSGAPQRRAQVLATPELAALLAEPREGQARYFSTLLGRTEVGTVAPVVGFDSAVLVTLAEDELAAAGRPVSNAILLGVVATLLAGGAVALVFGWLVLDYQAHLRRLADAERVAAAAASAASAAKSQFLSSMSHELRTPLNAVLGFSDLLQEQLGATLTDRQRRYLRNIHGAGAHLLELINDVLDLAKVEAGRLKFRPEALPLRVLLEPTLAAARMAAAARGVAFAADFPAEARVRLDAGRARQILYNLLSNAVKFTPPGGRVSLAARVDGTALVFEVADTGIGIPAALRDRVFGTFERLHEGRSEASGTGLGLALTKRLVEAHAGTIDFASAEGEGTTFRVRLPEAALVQDVREHVLVVEDEPRDAELIVALAAQVGLDCEIVGGADEALAEARAAQPLGVVLDLRLPDARGERVLRELKADPATRAIPVIVVTIEDEGTGLRADGADDYLVKPIDRGRLLAWLRLLAEKREARHAVAAG